MPKAPPTIKATINPDLCKIEGCDRPRHARGLCSPHWATGKNHGWLDQIGDPKKAPGPQRAVADLPPGADRVLADIGRIQREQAAGASAVNKKPVDLGDVPPADLTTYSQADHDALIAQTALRKQRALELVQAWDRPWTFDPDHPDHKFHWTSPNKLNGQTSLIVWWDDAWHWNAVDGDRVLALGEGGSAAEIYGQYKEWNKNGVVVDNDWDGANETGTGDSDSLISGVVGIDSGEPTVPAAVAATVAEAQLAEAGRLAVRAEGLQADLDMAKTEINHLEKDLKRTQEGWDKSDAAREEMETQLEAARARIAELEGVAAGVKKHRDTLMVTVATVTACHQRRCSELEAAQWMLAALGIKADSVVAGIQQLAQLPTNVLARRWAAWAKAQDLMGQAEAELRVARGEVDDA